MNHAAVSAAGIGANNIIAAPGAGKQIRVTALNIQANGAVSFHLRSGAGGTFHYADATNEALLAAGEGLSLVPAYEHFLCDENQPLNLDLSAAVAVVGKVSWEVVDIGS